MLDSSKWFGRMANFLPPSSPFLIFLEYTYLQNKWGQKSLQNVLMWKNATILKNIVYDDVWLKLYHIKTFFHEIHLVKMLQKTRKFWFQELNLHSNSSFKLNSNEALFFEQFYQIENFLSRINQVDCWFSSTGNWPFCFSDRVLFSGTID